MTAMNFKIGFITGAAAGYSLAKFLTEPQRRALEERLAVASQGERVGRVAGAVQRSAARVADSVTHRAAKAADKAGERAASALVGDEDASTVRGGRSLSTEFGAADREPTAAESAAAEVAAETAPDVGDTYDDMARRGAEIEGEGAVP